MRIAVFIIALLNLAWFLALAVMGPEMPDAAGQGWVTLIGMGLAAFHIPALVLAINRKALWLALILVLIPLLWVLNGLIQSNVLG